MIKISIIGSGNVASHLIRAFSLSKEVEIVQVFARKKESVENFIAPDKITSDLSELEKSDLYIISVSDDAIAEISEALDFSGRLVVHTSGTKPLDILSKKNKRGVFYPLQTFSRDKEVNFRETPICLETENKDDYLLLEKVAYSISDKVFRLDSDKRKALHVSAVFVSNFVNHLYRIGSEICEENDIPFEILKPLIMEVADKINYLHPKDAQTGPAKRGDLQVIESHLSFLKNDKQNQEIYELLSKAIISKNL